MLEEKDLQAIAQLMDQKLRPIQDDLSDIKAEQKAMKADIAGIKTRLDVEVMKQFKLLAEGQQTILETLAPKSRVEVLEDEMAFIKSVVKSMSQRIAELEKAQ